MQKEKQGQPIEQESAFGKYQKLAVRHSTKNPKGVRPDVGGGPLGSGVIARSELEQARDAAIQELEAKKGIHPTEPGETAE